MKSQTRKQTLIHQKESAVSPVIGVMLMLVVTIIIAAFVSVFAGGTFSSTEVAPSASLDVSIISNGGESKDQYVMLIKHLGGDSIASGDMQVVSYYTTPDGNMIGGSLSKTLPAVKAGKLSYTDLDVKIPYLNDLSIGKPGDTGTNLGEYTFSPGDVISTGDSFGTAVALFGILTTGTVTEKTYTDYGFKRGSLVEVEIIHTPSQKSVYKGKVTVQ
ncbi:MAG: type IV pilin N-terminal domain-containing protein [Methanocorpusculum sp.]|nr:type IV pilin N-terminal domain-containing protein [Methanocorpusculum sp.]